MLTDTFTTTPITHKISQNTQATLQTTFRYHQQPVPPAIEEAVVREYKRELFWRAKCHTWLIPKPNSHQTPLSFQAARRWRNCAADGRNPRAIYCTTWCIVNPGIPLQSPRCFGWYVYWERELDYVYSVRWRLYLPDSSIHWCHIFLALIFSLRLLQNQCSRRNEVQLLSLDQHLPPKRLALRFLHLPLTIIDHHWPLIMWMKVIVSAYGNWCCLDIHIGFTPGRTPLTLNEESCHKPADLMSHPIVAEQVLCDSLW